MIELNKENELRWNHTFCCKVVAFGVLRTAKRAVGGAKISKNVVGARINEWINFKWLIQKIFLPSRATHDDPL